MPRIHLIGLVALAAQAAAPAARAGDEIESDTPGADVRETRHRRDVVLAGPLARITDRLRLENRSDQARQLIYRFDLPAAAALTGVAVEHRGKAVRAVAVDAEAAIRPLPDGGDASADLALLREIEPDAGSPGTARYELSIYPVPPRSSVAVDIAWLAPLPIADGRVSLRLPPRGEGDRLAATELSVSAAPGRGIGRITKLTIDGAPVAGPRRLPLPDRRGAVIQGAAAIGGRGLRLSYQAVPLAGDLHALVLSGVAPMTARLPERFADAILAIDVSASMGQRGLEAAATIADRLVASLHPATRIEVVLFDRRAHPLLGGLAPGRRRARAAMAKALANRPLVNGSDLGAAVVAIDRLVTRAAAAGEGGATAVVVISDAATPLSQTPAALQSELSTATRRRAVFFAVTLERPGIPLPHPVAGALSELVARSGGASFATRPKNAAQRARLVARHLAEVPPLVGLEAAAGGRRLEELSLPSTLVPGAAFLAVAPWSGPPPRQLVVTASRRGNPVSQAVALRRDRRLEAAAALLVRRLSPAQIAESFQRAAKAPGQAPAQLLAAAGLRHPVASPFLSLVAPAPESRFGRERLAFARRWGTWLYRRAPTPAERAGAVEQRPWRPRASGPEPKVAMAQVRGALDASTFKRAVRNQMFRRVRHCYERELRTSPKLEGSIVVRIEAAGGEVQEAGIDGGSLTRASLRQCVTDAAYQLRPPTARGDGETIYVIRYPFRLHVAKKGAQVEEGSKAQKAGNGWRTDPLDGID